MRCERTQNPDLRALAMVIFEGLFTTLPAMNLPPLNQSPFPSGAIGDPLPIACDGLTEITENAVLSRHLELVSLRQTQRIAPGHRHAQSPHEPIGASVQEQPELVGGGLGA
jgi:hypothetical protein